MAGFDMSIMLDRSDTPFPQGFSALQHPYQWEDWTEDFAIVAKVRGQYYLFKSDASMAEVTGRHSLDSVSREAAKLIMLAVHRDLYFIWSDLFKGSDSPTPSSLMRELERTFRPEDPKLDTIFKLSIATTPMIRAAVEYEAEINALVEEGRKLKMPLFNNEVYMCKLAIHGFQSEYGVQYRMQEGFLSTQSEPLKAVLSALVRHEQKAATQMPKLVGQAVKIVHSPTCIAGHAILSMPGTVQVSPTKPLRAGFDQFSLEDHRTLRYDDEGVASAGRSGHKDGSHLAHHEQEEADQGFSEEWRDGRMLRQFRTRNPEEGEEGEQSYISGITGAEDSQISFDDK